MKKKTDHFQAYFLMLISFLVLISIFWLLHGFAPTFIEGEPPDFIERKSSAFEGFFNLLACSGPILLMGWGFLFILIICCLFVRSDRKIVNPRFLYGLARSQILFFFVGIIFEFASMGWCDGPRDPAGIALLIINHFYSHMLLQIAVNLSTVLFCVGLVWRKTEKPPNLDFISILAVSIVCIDIILIMGWSIVNILSRIYQ